MKNLTASIHRTGIVIVAHAGAEGAIADMLTGGVGATGFTASIPRTGIVIQAVGIAGAGYDAARNGGIDAAVVHATIRRTGIGIIAVEIDGAIAAGINRDIQAAAVQATIRRTGIVIIALGIAGAGLRQRRARTQATERHRDDHEWPQAALIVPLFSIHIDPFSCNTGHL